MASERIPEILVVEDEAPLADLERFHLERAGLRVRIARSAPEAEAAVRRRLPDLILLDLMLPGGDGLELCRRWRTSPRTRHLPILMVTARASEEEIVAGLELGADDYVTKPFSPRVLVARVRSLLRRPRPPEVPPDTIEAGPLRLDVTGRRLSTPEGSVALSPAETKLLAALMERPRQVFPRERLLTRLAADPGATSRLVDVHVAALRRKLGAWGRQIETVRGVGYRFEPPTEVT